MTERSIFHVRRMGDYWEVRPEGAPVAALQDPSKEKVVTGAFKLAEEFEPSVVIVHHEQGPPTRRTFGLMPEAGNREKGRGPEMALRGGLTGKRQWRSP